MILEYKGHRPKIGKNVFIAPTATIIGDVEIKDGASIWYGTVLRGDRAAITVGKNSNIQDNSTVHSDPGKPAIIGDNVTVGHNAVIHAAGSVVKQNQTVGPYHLMTGIPATFKKELSKVSVEQHKETAESYSKLALEHRAIKKAGQ